ncbi:Mss4-like protein [Immersiella caudata]|uniref:Mss4-like protein n=1 Tax=Immersiella caudata TaxID=314043 RepID=A0AA39WW49_9PEZI|nr:Mss4-like protein [Immersiella caudata]
MSNNPTSLSPQAFQEALEALHNITMAGSCHCGAVRFKVSHPPLDPQPTCQVPVSNCNCSICQKNGYLAIYPNRKDIEWLSGWDEMKNYRFGSKNRDHKFCGICGSSVCIDFLGNWHVGDVIGVNVGLRRAVLVLVLTDRWCLVGSAARRR